MTDSPTRTRPKQGPGKSERRGSPQLRIVYSPQYHGRAIFPLLKGTTTIGRAEGDGKIAFPNDDLMSKIHASIKVSETDGIIFLSDHSKNGTSVGTVQLRKNELLHRIEAGDILRFGNTIAIVRHEPVKPDDVAIPSLVGISLVMRDLRCLIAKAAVEDGVSILLRGETGSGKEVVAQAIHQLSRRKNGPFVAVNCAAIPETLAESEFFGNTRNAFTNAATRRGFFRAADNGSLFLDEIGDMDRRLQPRLFRALSEKSVMPVGSDEAIPTDFRLIAATNQPLYAEGQTNNFRKELFSRIAQFQIHIPPLRERKEDILPLLAHFYPDVVSLLDADFVHALVRHDWPLNVRQLFNISQQLRIERATQHVVRLLEQLESPSGYDGEEEQPGSRDDTPVKPTKSERRSDEHKPHVLPSKAQLVVLMTDVQGNVSRAAQELGCDRRSVRRYLALHGLSASTFRKPASDPKGSKPKPDEREETDKEEEDEEEDDDKE